MQGNPVHHWIALAVSSVLMALPAMAILRGWVPSWLRGHTGGLRPRAYGLLCLYAGMLANGVPRLANASYDVVMVSAMFGIASFLCAGVLFFLSAVQDKRARN